MGFMDKFKEAAQTAKAASGGVGGMSARETAAKHNKIGQQGVQQPAVLKSFTETGKKDPLSGGVECEMEVEVQPPGGEPYSAVFSQQILAPTIDGYKAKVGGQIVVNVDPDNPQSMILWG
jgi:hypothetical protein